MPRATRLKQVAITIEHCNDCPHYTWWNGLAYACKDQSLRILPEGIVKDTSIEIIDIPEWCNLSPALLS